MAKERRRRESDDVSIGAAMAHAHQERDSARKDARKASGEASGIPDGEFPIHDCCSLVQPMRVGWSRTNESKKNKVLRKGKDNIL